MRARMAPAKRETRRRLGHEVAHICPFHGDATGGAPPPTLRRPTEAQEEQSETDDTTNDSKASNHAGAEGGIPAPLLLVAFTDRVSMTFWAIHSPKAQPLSGSPAEPNSCWIVSCLNAQVAVLFAAEGASQETLSVPVSVLMTPLRSMALVAPQNVVFARQVHLSSIRAAVA